METVAQPPADDDLHLLTEWGDAGSSSRTRTAAVFSILVHVVLIVGLAFLPPEMAERTPEPPASHRVVTPLIAPLTELTQKDPTKGKINKEITASEITPRPRIQVPAAIPSTSRPKALQPAPVPNPAPPAPKLQPAMPLPDAPKFDASAKQPPKSDLPQGPATAPPPPPQIQPEEKPKLAFENPSAAPGPVAPGQGRVPIPNQSVADIAKQTLHGGSGGGLTVGDAGIGSGGMGAGINLPPTPGAPASQIQLLSDPQGVDFRPYLIRILASVKQHWLAVIPESVRMGRQGKVAIQFYIARDGNVPKVVIATPSGADSLDRAAVAGISASVPFPPLPTEYKGDKILLQFNFAYNATK